MRGSQTSLLLWGAFVTVSACANEIDTTGGADVSVGGAALSAADVVRVELVVSAPDMPTARVVALSHRPDGSWRATIGGLPSGAERTFAATAYDAMNAAVYAGSATGVTVPAGGAVVVLLRLQQVIAPDPFHNAAPVVNALIASSDVVSEGGALAMRVDATDPDGEPLAYAWSADGGSFDDATSSAPVWTAPPSAGAHTLTALVSDPRGGHVSVSYALVVGAARGMARVTATVNTWPVVAGTTSSLGRIDVGDTTVLAVTASDPDGDTLTYAWTSTCAGSFGSPTASSTTFTPSALSSSRCTFTAEIADGVGGSNEGSVEVSAGPAPPPRIAPRIDETLQGSEDAAPGDTITFSVAATDPDGGGPLAFAWSSSGGALGMPTSTASGSEITWTAPSCGAGSFHVSVSVTDDDGQSTAHTFDVTAPAMSLCRHVRLRFTGFDVALGSSAVMTEIQMRWGGVVHTLTGAPFTYHGITEDFATNVLSNGSLSRSDGYTYMGAESPYVDIDLGEPRDVDSVVITQSGFREALGLEWTIESLEVLTSEDGISYQLVTAIGGLLRSDWLSEVPRELPLSTVTGTSCLDVLAHGGAASGPYAIQIRPGEPPVTLYCDQVTEGGGWTLVMKTDASMEHDTPGALDVAALGSAATAGVAKLADADIVLLSRDTLGEIRIQDPAGAPDLVMRGVSWSIDPPAGTPPLTYLLAETRTTADPTWTDGRVLYDEATNHYCLGYAGGSQSAPVICVTRYTGAPGFFFGGAYPEGNRAALVWVR